MKWWMSNPQSGKQGGPFLSREGPTVVYTAGVRRTDVGSQPAFLRVLERPRESGNT